MNNRVNQLGVSQPQITTDGSNQIDVQLPDVTNVSQAENDGRQRPPSCSSTTGKPTCSTPDRQTGCQRAS